MGSYLRVRQKCKSAGNTRREKRFKVSKYKVSDYLVLVALDPRVPPPGEAGPEVEAGDTQPHQLATRHHGASLKWVSGLGLVVSRNKAGYHYNESMCIGIS